MPKNQVTQELEKEFTKGNLKPTQIKKSKSAEELKSKPTPSESEAQGLTSQLATTQEKLNNSLLALKAAEEQINRLTADKENAIEALDNLQTRLQGHEPSLLLKARQDLIAIRQQLSQLFPDSQAKPSELLSQLIQQQRELIDQNNELRLKSLKDSDALSLSQKNEDQYFAQYQAESKQVNQLKLHLAQSQKALTLTQQDLKQAQRIIELKLPENQKQTNPTQPNY